MENVTLNQKEQARLQILNSLLGAYDLDQAATLMGVSTRHTRRILRLTQKKEQPHSLTAIVAPNTTPDSKCQVLRLARTTYSGVNHTHQRTAERRDPGIDVARSTLRRILVESRTRQSTPPSSSEAPCSSATARGDADTDRGSYHRWSERRTVHASSWTTPRAKWSVRCSVYENTRARADLERHGDSAVHRATRSSSTYREPEHRALQPSSPVRWTSSEYR